jgi:hypothetical protein
MRSEGRFVKIAVKSTCLIMNLQWGRKRLIRSKCVREFKSLLKVCKSFKFISESLIDKKRCRIKPCCPKTGSGGHNEIGILLNKLSIDMSTPSLVKSPLEFLQ